jgi:hypothetical protein
MKFDAKATIARLTTTNVTCTQSTSCDSNYLLTHKDFPFSCVVSEWMLTRKGTNKIHLSSESEKAVRDQFGLSHELFNSAKGYAETHAKYRMENKPEVPNYANLSTIEGKRLESWYTKWFEYINTMEYLPLVMKCEEVLNSSNVNRKYADKVLSLTTETTERDRIAYSSSSRDTTITLKNKFSVMTISETSEKVGGRVAVDDWNMTTEQRERLFLFLDAMAKETK